MTNKPTHKGVLQVYENGQVAFLCPGCKFNHYLKIAPAIGGWGFNGNYDKPTFTPSVKVEGIMPMTDAEYVLVISGKEIEHRRFVCHSFVTKGSIQFLADSTHALANSTVPLQAE